MARRPNYRFERKERERAKAEKKARKAKAKAEKAEKAKLEAGDQTIEDPGGDTTDPQAGDRDPI